MKRGKADVEDYFMAVVAIALISIVLSCLKITKQMRG